MSLDPQVTTLVSVAGGITGIILALFAIAERVKKSFKVDLSEMQNDICKEIHEVKDIAKEARDDSKETLEKLNEHLLAAVHTLAEFEHLKERVTVHDAELERLLLKKSPV